MNNRNVRLTLPCEIKFGTSVIEAAGDTNLLNVEAATAPFAGFFIHGR